MSIRSERKEEHLAIAQMFFDPKKKNSFDQMHLLRPALPETKVKKEAIQTTMFGKKIAAPFFINAMTGGSKKSEIVNQALGKIAKDEQIALALGSASILAKEPDQLDSFLVARNENPDGIIIANINPLTGLGEAKKIVNELNADALQIHLNTVQELAMPEGDRNFNWLDNLRQLRQGLTLPLIIKEVGFGLDQKTITLLAKEKFDYLDIAGSGGTNFAQIENSRNEHDVSYLEDLGLPTVISALMAQKSKANFIVSGGVRNPLDVLKGLSLGSEYVGISNRFLQEYLTNGETGLSKLIQNWKDELAGLMAIFGCQNLAEIKNLPKYYDLPLKNQIDQLM